MGQPIAVLRRSSPRAGVVRYELNRNLTGMGHERYRAGEEIRGHRPADELARRLFARGGIEAVHVYGHTVTVELAEADDSGIADIIRDLYQYWVPGREVPADEELMAQAG
ncbi:MAG: hypothetical protein D6683_09490 [Actinomyces sp.]|nr:MAG: hypothetical protein D6683_09490 [Actinomyces sp.]